MTFCEWIKAAEAGAEGRKALAAHLSERMGFEIKVAATQRGLLFFDEHGREMVVFDDGE